MEAGQFKIGAIVQARMGSKRFPNKVLMPLPVDDGKTILEHIIESLHSVDGINDIVVATSDNPDNDDLANYVQSLMIKCYRGSEDDVLSRFYNIIHAERFDFVIRVTGDNPIIDSGLLEEFIGEFRSQELDYFVSSNLPVGCNFEIMRSEEIVKAHNNAVEAFDREHVSPYIKRHARKQGNFSFEGIFFNEKLRLTIDYPSDYAFLNIIFAQLGNEAISLKSVLNFVKENNWLISINSNNYQIRNYDSLTDEIRSILPLLKNRELYRLTEYLSEAIE